MKPNLPALASLLIATCLLLVSASLSGCGPGQAFGPTLTPTNTPTATSTPTPTNTPTATPTPTPRPSSIRGRLLGSDGPLARARVSLMMYADEECVALGESQQMSEQEEEQLDACRSEFASTTTDDNGQYAFLAIMPGWYSLQMRWSFGQTAPDVSFPVDIRDGFFIGYYETTVTPKVYSALAIQLDEFQVIVGEEKVIDFDYNKP